MLKKKKKTQTENMLSGKYKANSISNYIYTNQLNIPIKH